MRSILLGDCLRSYQTPVPAGRSGTKPGQCLTAVLIRTRLQTWCQIDNRDRVRRASCEVFTIAFMTARQDQDRVVIVIRKDSAGDNISAIIDTLSSSQDHTWNRQARDRSGPSTDRRAARGNRAPRRSRHPTCRRPAHVH